MEYSILSTSVWLDVWDENFFAYIDFGTRIVGFNTYTHRYGFVIEITFQLAHIVVRKWWYRRRSRIDHLE